MTTTVIDLLRHGEPEGGAMYRGSGTDDPLSERGWQQMRAAVEQVMAVEQTDACLWDAVVSSPMIRCKAFVEEVAKQHALPLTIIEDLKEAGYGAWEGRVPDEIRATEPEAYRALYHDPVNCRPHGAEPLAAFTHRVMDAFEELMVTYQGQRVLLVSHAGTMRAIQSQLIHAPIEYQQRIQIPYAGMYQVRESPWKGRQLIYK